MNKVYLVLPEKIGTINPDIYGHFTEHIGGVFYDGIWVGEESDIPNIRGFRKELVEKLEKINPPVIRWPGGCFAETYNWRDGIGKRDKRPIRTSWWTSYDGRYESNEVGTHEFVDFCKLAGAKPYFAANLTSTTPLSMLEWLDYCNTPAEMNTLAKEREENGQREPFNVPYWGVGNENWGGGGAMTPEHYALEYRKYAKLLANTFPETELFACGPNMEDYHWTEMFLKTLKTALPTCQKINGLSMHYYCFNLQGDSVDFDEKEWLKIMWQANHIDYVINRHWDVISGLNMGERAKLLVDEWGCWHREGSGPTKGYNLYEQQNTMRDAVTAAITLNVLNNNCDKVRMANVAQLVNNLHCLFLANGEHCIVTPTYHVFDMYKEHQGGTAVKCITDVCEIDAFNEAGKAVKVPGISVSASYKDNKMTVTIANLSPDEDIELNPIEIGYKQTSDSMITLLTSKELNAHNTFECPKHVMPTNYSQKQGAKITVPRASVISICYSIELE